MAVGLAHLVAGRDGAAAAALDEAVGALRAADDRIGEAFALIHLAIAEIVADALPEAAARLQAAVAMAKVHDEPRLIGVGLALLALATARAGRPADAEALIARSASWISAPDRVANALHAICAAVVYGTEADLVGSLGPGRRPPVVAALLRAVRGRLSS